MGLLYGHECPQCGSAELVDCSDISTTATKAICNDCGYQGVVAKKGARR